jgi:hypothetical protein
MRPRSIRHMTAMHLRQSAVEVDVIRSVLGHVSIATTNRYLEIDFEMNTKFLEACEVGGSLWRPIDGPVLICSPGSKPSDRQPKMARENKRRSSFNY